MRKETINRIIGLTLFSVMFLMFSLGVAWAILSEMKYVGAGGTIALVVVTLLAGSKMDSLGIASWCHLEKLLFGISGFLAFSYGVMLTMNVGGENKWVFDVLEMFGLLFALLLFSIFRSCPKKEIKEEEDE